MGGWADLEDGAGGGDELGGEDILAGVAYERSVDTDAAVEEEGNDADSVTVADSWRASVSGFVCVRS